MKIKLTESQYKKVLIEQGATVTTSPGTKPYTGTYDTSVDNTSGDKGITDVIDALQHILDWAGLIPFYGDAIDFVNAVIYFLRDKKLEALLSIIAIIPVVGSIIAIPFKLIFRLIPTKWVIKIMELIVSGGKIGGKATTEGFIKIAGEKAPAQMEKILVTLNKNLDSIKPAIDKLNAPFAYIEKLNHKLIPDYVENLARKGAKKGSAVTKGIKNWLFGMGDSMEAKTIAEAHKLYKKAFIDATSPEEWQLQVKKLLSGDGDKAAKKQEFIEAVSNPKKAIVKSVGGVKIPADEIHIIEAALKSKGTTKSWGFNTQTGEYNSVSLRVTINGKVEYVRFAIHDKSYTGYIDASTFKMWKGYDKAMQKWRAAVGKKPGKGIHGEKMIKIVKEMNMPAKYWQTVTMDDQIGGIVISDMKNFIGLDVDKLIIVKPTSKTTTIEDIKWFLEHEITHVYQPSQFSKKLINSYKASNTLKTYTDAKVQFNKIIPKVDKNTGKILLNKNGKEILKPIYTTKEKANAIRQVFKDHIAPSTGISNDIIFLTDKELINYVNKLADNGNQDMQEVIFRSTNNLMYWMHRWEVEAQLNALLKTIREKGQQKEYQGFITWLENYLRGEKGTPQSIRQIEQKMVDIGLSNQFLRTLLLFDNMKSLYPKTTKQVYGELYKQIQNMKKAGFSESIKRKMKIKLTEKQYKLIKEQEVKIPNDPLIGSIYGHEEKESTFLNNVQYVFDIAGLIPVYGDLIDAINSIIYFIRGKNLEGFLSIIAIIPVVGSIISIPFKVLFKLIPQSAIKKIVNFIHTGNGKQAAQTLIKIGKEKAPNELKKVLEIVRYNITPIKKGLDKLTEPLVELQKFNHKFIPDYLSNKINKLGNKGIVINNAVSKFLKTIDASNDVIIKPLKKATTKEIIKLSKIANEVEKLSVKDPYLTMYHGTSTEGLTLSNLHLGVNKPGMGKIRKAESGERIGIYGSPVVRGDVSFVTQAEGGTAQSYAGRGYGDDDIGTTIYIYEIKLKHDVKLYPGFFPEIKPYKLKDFVGGENNPSIAKLGDFDGAQHGDNVGKRNNETLIWKKDKIESIELVVKGEHNPDSKYWHDKLIWTHKRGIKLKENYFKNKKKIKLTEEQYKRVLLREFGETIRDPKEWYLRVLEWVDSPEDLDFERSEDEVVVYDTYGSYLGYYDKESEFGFVVTEYGIGLEDEGEEDEYIDEQDDAGDTGGDTGGGTGTKWEDIVSLTRGPANTLDNTPWSVSPARGPDNTLDNSPWPDSLTRGAANQLT